MGIVASAFDASSQRIVRYLSEEHDIAINTAFLTVFEENGETLLTTDWLLDQSEVVERSETRAKAPWSGRWYVNTGDGPSWEDMRKYGFIAAGAGERYSGLQPGDRIVAYQARAGYVGYGIVTSPSVIAHDFQTVNARCSSRWLNQTCSSPWWARIKTVAIGEPKLIGPELVEKVVAASALYVRMVLTISIVGCHAFYVHLDGVALDLRVVSREPVRRGRLAKDLPRREMFIRPISYQRFHGSLINRHEASMCY